MKNTMLSRYNTIHFLKTIHEIKKLQYFSSRRAVVFAQSIETRC